MMCTFPLLSTEIPLLKSLPDPLTFAAQATSPFAKYLAMNTSLIKPVLGNVVLKASPSLL